MSKNIFLKIIKFDKKMVNMSRGATITIKLFWCISCAIHYLGVWCTSQCLRAIVSLKTYYVCACCLALNGNAYRRVTRALLNIVIRLGLLANAGSLCGAELVNAYVICEHWCMDWFWCKFHESHLVHEILVRIVSGWWDLLDFHKSNRTYWIFMRVIGLVWFSWES